MLPFNLNKKNCTGCGACYNICPRRCISMKPDEEGFFYPTASSECINCGLCEQVCPIVHPILNGHNDKQSFYAGISKSFDLWQNSASGGAFSEICNAWGNAETIVIGAAWNGLDVHHVAVIGIDNIAPLRKSKYISSTTESVFRTAKDVLNRGNRVIFCGTPCQVAGLKRFLKKDYQNLLTIDLICHGVGSPKVFKECIKQFEYETQEKVVSYEFRSKRKKYETDHISLIKTENSEHLYSLDRYNQLFLDQLCLRPSCGGNCQFRNSLRVGDVTIADFKGLNRLFPQLVANCMNYSTITLNTDKGLSLIDKLQNRMDMYECRIKDIVNYNPLFAGHTWFNNDRDVFFDDFVRDSKNAIIKWTVKDRPFECHPKVKLFNSSPKIIRKLAMFILKKKKR